MTHGCSPVGDATGWANAGRTRPGRPRRALSSRSPPAPARSRRSDAVGAVDRLAQQVRVTVVPGVLLDHVDKDLPSRDLVTPPRSCTGLAERVDRRRGRARGAKLDFPGRKAFQCVVRDPPSKSRSGSASVLWGRDIVSRQAPLEPAALHLCHVPGEAHQGQARRRDRPRRELFRKKAFALQGQRRPWEVEPRLEHRAFFGDERCADSFHEFLRSSVGEPFPPSLAGQAVVMLRGRAPASALRVDRANGARLRASGRR